jgi:molybdopterin-synthase adenylyltransferase
MSAGADSRYCRQIALPQLGTAGQQRLAQASALVIGLGGLGCPAALYLARCGVGRITLNDFDRVDESNLPRQILFSSADCGRNKAEAAAERLAIDTAIQLQALPERLDASALHDAMTTADVVLDATDNFASRWLINRACVAARKPLVSGAAIRFEGQVAVFRHDRPGGPCYRCLYDEEDENLEHCAGQGILAPVAGAIGSLMATEALKILAGIDSGLAGKLWAHDLLAGTSRTIAIRRRADCPACSGT